MRPLRNLILVLCTVFMCFTSCKREREKPEISDHKPAPLTVEELKIEVQTYQQENGWGFDLIVNDQKYVHQPYIPVIQGNHPFKTEDDAKKVGELMKQKIQGNVVPPTITLEELQVLNVEMPG